MQHSQTQAKPLRKAPSNNGSPPSGPRSSRTPFPFTDEYVRSLPRSHEPPGDGPLSCDQRRVAESYRGFSLAEGRKCWRGAVASGSGAFARRRFLGDEGDAEAAAEDALLECCRRWPLPCPGCQGRGRCRDPLKGTGGWTCPDCDGTGRPRNDFTAFHAYLRLAVRQRVSEEFNRRVREAKRSLDTEADGGPGWRRNGRTLRMPDPGPGGLGGRPWVGVFQADECERVPAALRRLRIVCVSEVPPSAAAWSRAQGIIGLTTAYGEELRASLLAEQSATTWSTIARECRAAGGALVLGQPTTTGRALRGVLAEVLCEVLAGDFGG